MKKMLYFVLFFLCSHIIFAADIQIGKQLPAVSVEKDGRMVLKDGKISYEPWNSNDLVDKVRTVYLFAGTIGASKINEAFIDDLIALKLPTDRYQTTSIVNMDDAAWGLASILQGKVESKKKDFPIKEFVIDQKAKVHNAWGLTRESSAVILLDKSGAVLDFKDGKLSDAERLKYLNIIKAQLGMN